MDISNLPQEFDKLFPKSEFFHSEEYEQVFNQRPMPVSQSPRPRPTRILDIVGNLVQTDAIATPLWTDWSVTNVNNYDDYNE